MSHTAPKIENKGRHMGIELLRSLAMMSILLQHVVMQGGVLYEAAVGTSTPAYLLCYALKCFSQWGSGVFALITGYLCVTSGPKAQGLIKIWFQTVFYGLVLTAVFSFAAPEVLYPDSWENALLPVLNRQYWYITCYMALVLISPALNAAVKGTGRRALALMLISMAVLFCLLPPIFTNVDVLNWNGGYSLWWLAYLYITGAWIRLYGAELVEKLRRRLLVLVLLVGGGVPWALKAGEVCFTIWGMPAWLTDFAARMAQRFDNRSTAFLLAVVLAVFLLGLKAKPAQRLEGIISFFARHSLGVYLIHVQPALFSWAYYIFAPYARLSMPLLLLAVLGTVMAVFLACVVADWLRSGLFRLVRLEALSRLLADKAETAVGRIIEK